MTNLVSTLAIVLVFSGAVIHCAVLALNRRLISQLAQNHTRNRWFLLSGMVVFFLISYLSYMVAFWGKQHQAVDLIVPVVFFLGACFVWLTANLSLQTATTVSQINLLEEENNHSKKNEQRLRNSLDLQTALLKSANVSIVATDTAGKITFFNRAAQDMLGYTEADVVGVATPALFHDNFEIAVRSTQLSQELGRKIEPGFETFVAKARSGIADENEWTYIRKDNSRFTVKLSVTCLYGKTGELTGFLSLAIDISRRKQAENGLKNSEQFIRSALDALSKQFCVLDESGTLLAINKPWLDFEEELGYDRQAFKVGKNYLDLIQSGHAALRGSNDYAENIRSVISGKTPSLLLEYSCRTSRTGAYLNWFSGKIIPFPDHELGSVILIHENVTEHKRLQHRFYQAVESAPNSILLVNEAGFILMVNLQAEASFGYSRSELIGQPMEILVPERFRDHHVGFRQGYFANPLSRPMGAGRELYGLRKDGSEFPVEIGLGLIDDEHGPIVLSSIIDISERKHASDQLKAALNEKKYC